MTGIGFKITGKLDIEEGRAVLLLAQDGRQYTLRLAYVLRGTEERILPESVLDDWGHEVSGLELYKWVKENAAYFPRAELFGYDLNGRTQQCFMRELDLAVGLPLYVYEEAKAPLSSGIQVHAVLLSSEKPVHQLTVAPAKISHPLREAAVEWWLVNEPESESGTDRYSNCQTDNEGANSV